MPRSIVIYGPKGCGKTQNAEALRKTYGMRTTHDSADMPFGGKAPMNNALILTEEPDGWSDFKTIPYATAIAKARKAGHSIITPNQ